MAKVNFHYKDRLFSALFGNDQRKGLTLSLYNSLNHTHYTNADDLRINTIDDVVYMGMKNDVSFLLANDLNLYEQQSTWNPNMPLREFCYAEHVIEAYLKETGLDALMYGNTLVKIPTPKLVVLYNGVKEEEDTVLRLSDCFEHGRGDLEATVHVYNINPGHVLPQTCAPLNDYAIFVDIYRKIAGGTRDTKLQMQAANTALNALPDGPVKQYISKQKGQVIDMLLTEYDAQKTMDAIARNEHRLGKAEGKAEGRVEGEARLVALISAMTKDGDAAYVTKISDPAFREEMYKKYNL